MESSTRPPQPSHRKPRLLLPWALGLALLATSQLAAGLTQATLGKNKLEGFEIVPPWTEGRQHSVTRGYGVAAHVNSGSKDQYALDFSLAAGDPVYPAAPGRVEYAGVATDGYKCYGSFVMVRHENDYQTLYAHLNPTLRVTTGQVVDTSTLLGNAGNSGSGTDPVKCPQFNAHLHFALYRGARVSLTGSVGPDGGTAVVPEPFARCTSNNRPECADLGTSGTQLRKERPAPVTATDVFGRVYLFARRDDGQIRYRILYNSTANAWTPWATLADPVRRFTNVPAAALDSNNRIWVFARSTDGTMWFNVQTNPSSDLWHGWRNLGGFVIGNPALAQNSVDARAEGTGRLELFVRGADDGLYRAWQVSNDGWTAWQFLGGGLSSSPAAGRHTDGRPSAFIRGLNAAVYTKHPNSSGVWDPNTWGFYIGPKNVGELTTVRNHQGFLDLVTRYDSDCCGETNPDDFANFNDVDALRHLPFFGSVPALGPLGAPPAAGLNADGRLQLFGRTTDLQLRSVIQQSPGTWPAGAALAPLGVSTGVTSDLAVMRAADNRLHVAAWETDTVWLYSQGAANNGGSWTRMSLGIP